MVVHMSSSCMVGCWQDQPGMDSRWQDQPGMDSRWQDQPGRPYG